MVPPPPWMVSGRLPGREIPMSQVPPPEPRSSVAGLSGVPDVHVLPPARFVYLERRGPFAATAPRAWREFFELTAGQLDPARIVGRAALSRLDPSRAGDAAFVYQAGVLCDEFPARLPAGIAARQIGGERYAGFLLTGSYTQLAGAYPTAFALVAKAGLELRDDFCIERYLSGPDTPEADLMTQILLPVR